ncbi:MAG TPA: hypothetical protein VLV49_06505 [Terriglobales bacterium]|nr:hypothetical protein [Terriglobales bacterium]
MPATNPKTRVRRFEAVGVLLIAGFILLLTLARHWHNIPWGAR